MATITWWDAHTDKVSHRSTRWATTDRGWLFRDGESTALGHYLDYGPCGPQYAKQHPEGTVHAVVCGDRGAAARTSKWFATPADARAWIEEQAKAGKCPVNPASRIGRGARAVA